MVSNRMKGDQAIFTPITHIHKPGQKGWHLHIVLEKTVKTMARNVAILMSLEVDDHDGPPLAPSVQCTHTSVVRPA